MHDDDFEHEHYTYGDATEQALTTGELVRLVTVGIDVGSSTSHLMFSQLYLKRQGDLLSSRYVVVLREVVHRSPILLTPYTPDNNIDANKLADFVHRSYREAGIKPKEVDSGAIILTGEAVKRENARSIAEGLAGESGKFVCATAGHNLEAVLAAHGSGAVALSRELHQTLLNIDIGGGTTKLALIHDGDILETAAVNVGGRLVALDAEGRIARIEPSAREVAAELGLELELGTIPEPGVFEKLSARLAEVLMEVVALAGSSHEHDHPHAHYDGHGHHDAGHSEHHGPGIRSGHSHDTAPLTERLMLTPALHSHRAIQAVTFSGGVSEYLYEREERSFGDLARPLSDAIRRHIAAGGLPAPLAQAGERIRATVIGASQFTVQVSGNTIHISRPKVLPLHNLQVIYPRLPRREEIEPELIARAIHRAHERLDLVPGRQVVALAVGWNGTPRYQLLRNLASGIMQGMKDSLDAGLPLITVFNNDFGNLIGDILRGDLGVTNDVISVDGIELNEFDFIDIGEILRPAQAVPVVVKSLVFPAVGGPRAEVLAEQDDLLAAHS